MGRTKKRRGALQEHEASSPRKFKLGTRFSMALAALLAAGLAAGYSLTRWEAKGPGGTRAEVSASAGGGLIESRPTLPPSLFVGQVARAYRVAREIPEVLDRLYCYCYCKENMGHLNLLTCYTERHAST